jgi:hypothetical protein
MRATVCKQATAVTQATTVTPATSNKDDNNIMTARNSRNESNNRIANTMQTLEKVAKPATACREANYLRDVIKIRDATAAGIIGTSWMFTAPEPLESVGKSAAVEKPTTCMRDASNIRDSSSSRNRNSQLERWK